MLTKLTFYGNSHGSESILTEDPAIAGYNGYTSPDRAFTSIVRDAYGISDREEWVEVTIPAINTANDASVIVYIPRADSWLEEVTYTPLNGMTGGSAGRTWTLVINNATASGINQSTTNQTAIALATSTTAAVANTEMVLGSVTSTLLGVIGMNVKLPLLYVQSGTPVIFTSTHLGTGVADGGRLRMRFAGRLSNHMINGAAHIVSNYGTVGTNPGPTQGGVSTITQASHPGVVYGDQIVCSVAASTTNTTVTVQALAAGVNLFTGDLLPFSGGTTATVNGSFGAGTTVITVNALPGNIAIGEVAYHKQAINVGYQASQTPRNGVVIIGDSINDVGGYGAPGTFPNALVAYKNAMRAEIARACCSFLLGDVDNTIIYQGTTNGGTWGLEATPAVPWGAHPAGRIKGHECTVGGSPLSGNGPTATITVGLPYQGGAIDLFFRSKVGLAGGIFTITEGGGASFSVNGDASATSHSVDTGSAVTSEDNPTGSSLGMILVRRITGLSAGTHKIIITPTTLAVGHDILFDSWGVEAISPTQPVFVLNTPKLPTPGSGSYTGLYPGYTDTRVNTWNTNLAATVAEFTGGNVILVDIDTAMNQDPLNFIYDGVHWNDRGHAIVANAIIQAINAYPTPTALLYR
jgi:hypothetical protein